MCLLRVITQENFIWGVMPKKDPISRAGIGISSLYVESNNFRTASPILVIRCSSDAAPQKKFDSIGENAKICFWELLLKNSPKASFPAKYFIQ
jgi:hypothetical protein